MTIQVLNSYVDSSNTLKKGALVSRTKMNIQDRIYGILKSKEEDMNKKLSFEQSKEFGETFEREFSGQLDMILSFGFKDTLFNDLQGKVVGTLGELLESYKDNGTVEEQIKNLILNMRKIPAQQAMSMKDVGRAGGMYCDTSAATFQLIFERYFTKSGTSFQVLPYGHAAQVVQIADTYYYVDARNGIFTDITGKIRSENQDGMRIFYAIRPEANISQEVTFGILPAGINSRNTILSAYFGNLAESLDIAVDANHELNKQVNPKTFSIIRTGMTEYLKNIHIEPSLVTEEFRLKFRKEHNHNEQIVAPEMFNYKLGDEFQQEIRRCSERRRLVDSLKNINPEFTKTIRENAAIVRDAIISNQSIPPDLYTIFPQKTAVEPRNAFLIDVIIEDLRNMFLMSGITNSVEQGKEFDRLIFGTKNSD